MTAIKEKKQLAQIAQKYSLDLVLLFGSRAAGKSYNGSDFDIAYLSSKQLNLDEESKLIVDLAPLVKSENIDLVNLKKASPLLFYAVLNNCRVLYEKKPFIFAAQRIYAFKKYIEAQPFYEEKFKRFKERIKSL